MSRENKAIITVRYYVGEDRELSLVKLYKKIDEVPIVSLTLTSKTSDDMALHRVAEEITQKLSEIKKRFKSLYCRRPYTQIYIWIPIAWQHIHI